MKWKKIKNIYKPIKYIILLYISMAEVYVDYQKHRLQ